MLKAWATAPLPIELGGSRELRWNIEWPLPRSANRRTSCWRRISPTSTRPRRSLRHSQVLQPVPRTKHGSIELHARAAAACAAAARGQPRRIHIDQFSGDVEYSPSDVALHKAMIQEGSARIKIDGSAALDKGNFTDNSQFQVQAAVHDADIAELQHASGTELSAQRQAELHAAGGGHRRPIRTGSGQISLTDGEAHGRPINALTSKIQFRQSRRRSWMTFICRRSTARSLARRLTTSAARKGSST